MAAGRCDQTVDKHGQITLLPQQVVALAQGSPRLLCPTDGEVWFGDIGQGEYQLIFQAVFVGNGQGPFAVTDGRLPVSLFVISDQHQIPKNLGFSLVVLQFPGQSEPAF